MADIIKDLKSEENEEFQTERVLTVVGAHFAHDSFSAFISPLLPLIRDKLSIGYGSAGNLAIWLQLPSLLNPFIGYMADKVNLRYFIILAPAVTATLMSLMGIAPTYLTLIFLLLATGFSVAAFHAPAPALIGEISGKYVGRGMSLFMAGGELGRALGPVAVVWAVGQFGLEGIWRLAFVGWAVSLILWFRLREIDGQQVAKKVQVVSAETRQRARRFFPPLTTLMLFRAAHLATLTTFLPLYMRDEAGASLWLAAASLTILEIAGVVGALATGTMSDKFGRINILSVLLFCAPIFTLIFIFLPTTFAVPMLILVGIAAISTTPVILAMVQDQFKDNRAFANGIFMALNFLARAAGIWIIGWLADNQGLQFTFTIASVAAFLTLPALWWLKQQYQERI
ncbi:MAG: MFS transporter [Candidatus Promineifilaceae bacterium]